MAAQHAGILLFLWIIVSVATGEKVTAKPGEDATLQCHTSTDAAVTVLEWSRPELEHYVFYYRDNELMERYQDPRYRGRVELNNPEMKNGDASVLLKNVSINDSGTYQCEVITHSNNRRKRDLGDLRKFVRSIHLSISEGSEKQINKEHPINGDANDEQPGGPRGYVGLGVGVGLGGLIVGVVAGLVVKSKRAQLNRPLESVDEQVNVKLNP